MSLVMSMHATGFLLVLLLSQEAHAARKILQAHASVKSSQLRVANWANSSGTGKCSCTCQYFAGEDACPGGKVVDEKRLNRKIIELKAITKSSGVSDGSTLSLLELMFRLQGMMSCLDKQSTGKGAVELVLRKRAKSAIEEASSVMSGVIHSLSLKNEGHCSVNLSSMTVKEVVDALPRDAPVEEVEEALHNAIIREPDCKSKTMEDGLRQIAQAIVDSRTDPFIAKANLMTAVDSSMEQAGQVAGVVPTKCDSLMEFRSDLMTAKDSSMDQARQILKQKLERAASQSDSKDSSQYILLVLILLIFGIIAIQTVALIAKAIFG